MHAVCEGFDDFFSRWYPDIRRLCFAMTENDKDARNLAFKTFLRLGAAKDPQIKENDAKFLLFSSGFTLCVDYFGRKLHRLPDKKALEGMSLPFAVTDNLCVPEAAARPTRGVLPCACRIFRSGNRENRRKIRRAFCLFFHTESRFGAGSRFFHSIRRKRRRCHERRNLCALCRAQRRRGKQDSRFSHRL